MRKVSLFVGLALFVPRATVLVPQMALDWVSDSYVQIYKILPAIANSKICDWAVNIILKLMKAGKIGTVFPYAIKGLEFKAFRIQPRMKLRFHWELTKSIMIATITYLVGQTCEFPNKSFLRVS